MNDKTRPPPPLRVVLRLPDEAAVVARRDVPYRQVDPAAHAFDVYSPPHTKPGDRTPAVIIVAGFPDPALRAVIGANPKDTEYWRSWARIIAASGMVAITYSTTEPATDTRAMIDHVRSNAAALGIDEARIGLCAWSGHVPNALSLLIEEPKHIRCAVLCYGFMLDLDGATHVASAARQFGMVNPASGKSVDDLPSDIPLLITRAGRDRFDHLNESIDRFVAHALRRNLPLTLVNLPDAAHAFDMTEDNATSHEAIKQMLAFMRLHLLGFQGARGV